MARCSCAGSSCSCTVQAGAGLTLKGTGNTSSPFILSLASLIETVVQNEDGPLDLTPIDPWTVVKLALDADVTSIALPPDPGARFELVVTQGPSPKSITWPAEVKWPGGVEPTLTTTPDHTDVISIRRLGDLWIGNLTSADLG